MALDSRLLSSEVHLARDLYALPDRACHGAASSVVLEHPLYLLAILFLGAEVEGLLDPLDYQHLLLGLYLPHRLGVEAIFIEGHLTRCQRARKGAQQSAAGCGHQVIEGGVMGFNLLGGEAVVFGYLAVDAEEHRLFLDGKVGASDLTLDGLHSYA